MFDDTTACGRELHWRIVLGKKDDENTFVRAWSLSKMLGVLRASVVIIAIWMKWSIRVDTLFLNDFVEME